MSLEEKIHSELGIKIEDIQLSSPNHATCIVHSKWIIELLSLRRIPQDPSKFGELKQDVHLQFVNQTDTNVIANWKKIAVFCISKEEKKKLTKLLKVSPNLSSSSTDLNYFQLIHYVTETNYKNLWKQAWHKYRTPDPLSATKVVEHQNYDLSVRMLIKRMFNCPIICIDDSAGFDSASDSNIGVTHSNSIQLLCAVESKNYFYLLYEKPLYNLHQGIMFSPSLLETSMMRQLFIVYELLHFLRTTHNNGLCMGPITLRDIHIDQNLWVHVFPSIFDETTSKTEQLNRDKDNDVDNCDVGKENIEMTMEIPLHQSDEDLKNGYLQSLTEKWIKVEITNFDYLMELNKLAGRIMNNPHCHPVLPWIVNFSVPEGGWRDLSKSKFRLNKGDKQLDLLYESASLSGNITAQGNVTNLLQTSAVMVPHHTSDVITDITYYVYKARRMSKSILCQHVRTKWVPDEYPSSVQRLQEWTPDECIPEFFTDPLIFKSIHSDLPDLILPPWCNTPEAFIKWHKAVLESDHVSERLHLWIDLTFGYRLTGSAAVKAKNVCLPLVDKHTTLKNHGMVQLFSHPHPHKVQNSLYFGSVAPKTFRSEVPKMHETKDSGEEETSSESSGKAVRWKALRSKSMPANNELLRSESRPENQTIVLPKDYVPHSALKQLESFYTFLAKTHGGKVPSTEVSRTQEISNELQNQSRDMLVLGCLISEICLASHLRLMPADIRLEERYFIICKVLRSYRNQIPRCFSQVIQLLLQLLPNFEPVTPVLKGGECCLPGRYSPVSTQGLPPPSPHQLLQPLIHTIPFPPYFPELYEFLEKLNNYSKELQEASNLEIENSLKQEKINEIAKAKVYFAAEKLQSLLPRLNTEALELLTPYLQELFDDVHTSLFATWHLFNTVSQHLGPHQTARKLIKSLIKVFDPDMPSSKYIKLYHRTFLLQLIIRLGLLNFLANFMTILIEAVGGLKDFATDDGYRDGSSDSSSKRKSSHLQSPELQHMAEESERNLNATEMTKVSTYDEDISQGDDEKDPEIFDYEDGPEDSAKNLTATEPAASNIEVPLIVRSEARWGDEESFDNENEQVLDEDNKEDDEDDPDMTDSLSSPIAETRKNSKPSLFSRSAPNPTSHLSQYKCSESSNSDLEQSGKSETSHLSDETMLSPGSGKCSTNLNISDVAVDSVMWLAHRLGPVLSARYLTRNLLRMLSLCYDGPEKKIIVVDSPLCSGQKYVTISNLWYSGDQYTVKVLDCLSKVAALYGEQFIMLQYLPHTADLLSLCKKRITSTLESGLIGAMALLQHIIPYLSDATLMDHLQDVIIKDILHVVIRLVSSLRQTFPSGGEARLIVTCRLMDIIYIIGLRIGFEMTRKHLSSTLQRFFSCFDKVYESTGEFKSLPDSSSSSSTQSNSPLKEKAIEEMQMTLTPKIAYLSYIPFCKLAGGIFMEQTLKNDELIRHLCLLHDINMAQMAPTDQFDSDTHSVGSSSSLKSHTRNISVGQEDSFVSGVFGKNVAVVGNRLDVHLGEDGHLVAPTGDAIPQTSAPHLPSVAEAPKYDINFLRRKLDNTQRHLKGNWIAYWEHEKGRSEKDDHFNFKQIKLQSFVGHTGAIRTIQALDNENSFLTSSKDKTVKLWSLRSLGDGTAQTPCQWTYTQHRKSVFAVSFLDSLRLVGSCDSTVHIWDPFMGSCIKQMESTKGSPITVLTAMPAPSTTFLAATTNSTVRFLDTRTCRYMHEFKVGISATGLIRCLAVSPNGNWLAVGHSTGMLSVLDIRTGMLFGAWMGHEGEVLQLKAFNNSYFVTSSLDHSMSVWNSEDSQPKCHLKGPMEPVTSLCFYKGEVISGTAGNKIGLHTAIDRKATYSSTRLRSDTFKGMLTTMALLPLNRLLLLGADNGNVVLLS